MNAWILMTASTYTHSARCHTCCITVSWERSGTAGFPAGHMQWHRFICEGSAAVVAKGVYYKALIHDSLCTVVQPVLWFRLTLADVSGYELSRLRTTFAEHAFSCRTSSLELIICWYTVVYSRILYLILKTHLFSLQDYLNFVVCSLML